MMNIPERPEDQPVCNEHPPRNEDGGSEAGNNLPVKKNKAGRKFKRATKTVEKILPWMGMLAAIATIAGLVAVAFEYNQRVELEQAKASMAMIEVWEDKNYKQQFENLRRDVDAEYAKADKVEISAINRLPLEVRITGLGEIGRKAVNHSGRLQQAKKEIDDLFYFFTRLAICVNTQVCSDKVSRAYFQDTVLSFWLYFNWYAEDRRTHNYGKFGADVEEFALQGQRLQK